MTHPFRFFEQIDAQRSEEETVLVAFAEAPNLEPQKRLVETLIPAASIQHFDDEGELARLWEEQAEHDEPSEPGTLFCIWTGRWAILHHTFIGDLPSGLDESTSAYLRAAHLQDPIDEVVLLDGVADEVREGGPKRIPVFKRWVSETPFGNLFEAE